MKKLYEQIGRLYVQVVELSEREDGLSNELGYCVAELEKAKSCNLDFQREIDALKFELSKKEAAINELKTELRNRDAIIEGYENKEAETEEDNW